MCFLEPLVCKRQVIGDHQQREIIAAAPILVKANHGLGTDVGINADKRIQNLAHAGPVCQRDVLQLCIHERKVRCKTADAGQLAERLVDPVFIEDPCHDRSGHQAIASANAATQASISPSVLVSVTQTSSASVPALSLRSNPPRIFFSAIAANSGATARSTF